MNLSLPESLLNRQRCRQWTPLITQQLRLRHIHQIFAFNLHCEKKHRFYYTLHLTNMSAPFYTSEQLKGPCPKWKELEIKDSTNTAIPFVVLSIWQHSNDGMDKIILSWGINLSGLVYLGNKIADIQPTFFNQSTVIFCMKDGYFTSHETIKTDIPKQPPFKDNLNLFDTAKGKKIYRRIVIKTPTHEVQNSYDLDKLRRLHSLQVSIKKKSVDVQIIKDKINLKNGLNSTDRDNVPNSSSSSSPVTTVRYAPQLLTMNSLNRMLQEKPTKVQKQEMLKISKEIEIVKFRTRLLSQERSKKSALLRQLKQKHITLLEENEERESHLMENYHKLSKDTEKIKEYKKSLVQHKEFFHQISSQLQHRRRQLMQELLFIYPIAKQSDDKYTIRGIYLPNSDILADCSDTGLAVALGSVTHILTMCSTFLQVPLRYPLTHYGSRSYISDNISPLITDRDRDFPLYTKGKEKMQFTYAVYLLNKNLAQLRWLFFMHTVDLKSTLPNLLSFLLGQTEHFREPFTSWKNKIDYRNESESNSQVDPYTTVKDKQKPTTSSSLAMASDKFVSLHSFGSNSNIYDPILDCIRHENQIKRSSSPTRKPNKPVFSKPCRSSECGPGLSEILAVPEAFLNKQITTDSFKNFITIEKSKPHFGDDNCCGNSTSPCVNNSLTSSLRHDSELDTYCDIHKEVLSDLNNSEFVEQGQDPLDPQANLLAASKSIKIRTRPDLWRRNNEDFKIKQKRRLSRSVGSYTDEEGSSPLLRTSFELGSEPLLNVSCDSQEIKKNQFDDSLGNGQREHFNKWLQHGSITVCSDKSLYPDEILGSSSTTCQSSSLNESIDAFNVDKPKQSDLEENKKNQLDDESGQQEHFKKWLQCGTITVCDDKTLYSEEILGSTTVPSHDSPLTERTDALLNTKSFNLVRPKQ